MFVSSLFYLLELEAMFMLHRILRGEYLRTTLLESTLKHTFSVILWLFLGVYLFLPLNNNPSVYQVHKV